MRLPGSGCSQQNGDQGTSLPWKELPSLLSTVATRPDLTNSYQIPYLTPDIACLKQRFKDGKTRALSLRELLVWGSVSQTPEI